MWVEIPELAAAGIDRAKRRPVEQIDGKVEVVDGLMSDRVGALTVRIQRLGTHPPGGLDHRREAVAGAIDELDSSLLNGTDDTKCVAQLDSDWLLNENMFAGCGRCLHQLWMQNRPNLDEHRL